jgi:Cytochrome bd-type quinol oxidase, subunit 1
LVNTDKEYNDTQEAVNYEIKFPKMLSFLATRDIDGYVPGIRNIIEGGYTLPNGEVALSAEEKIASGKVAIDALSSYQKAKKANDDVTAQQAKAVLEENIDNFGYGYIKDPKDLIPNVALNFYAFRIMVGLGMFFILLFAVLLFIVYKKDISKLKWLQIVGIIAIPLAYIASHAGWIVAEAGRQPWAIQDLLPVNAAISKISTGSVQTTFFIFLVLFTILLIAELSIMFKAIKKGPKGDMVEN